MAAYQGAATFCGFDLHPAIVERREAVHEGKAKARAGALSAPPPGLEAVEDSGLKVGGDSRTAVRYGDLNVILDNPGAKRNGAATGRIFQRIRQQIEDNLPNSPLIQHRRSNVRCHVEMEGNVAARYMLPQWFGRACEQLVKIGALELQPHVA